MKETVFILKPNEDNNPDNRPCYIIWAEDENAARQKAQQIPLPMQQLQNNEALEIRNSDPNFYTDEKKVQCSTISSEDWDILKNNNVLTLTYKKCPCTRRCPTCLIKLTKDDPKIFNLPSHT